MPAERTTILDLLPSHRTLLVDHHVRLVDLLATAARTGMNPSEIGFIVASASAAFGQACIAEGAGHEFLVVSDKDATMVVPVGIEGLMSILVSTVPEAVWPVCSRPSGTVPLLVVDAGDEPAIVLFDVQKLTTPRS